MEHYFDLCSTKEKILHLLAVGYTNNFYNRMIEICYDEFPKEDVNEAIIEFKNGPLNSLKKIT